VRAAAGDCDAIIVGASFGGLAAALGLATAGRVLLIDRDAIGANQTSACAAPLPVIERLGAMESVEQVHRFGVMHLPGGGGHRFRLRHPFATFDYERFCRLLFERTGAELLRTTALRIGEGGAVVTSQGEFRARVIVDASGPRRVLAASLPGFAASPDRSVGIELRLPGTGDGLHFWLHHEAMKDGYIWDFPAGDHRRVGVITYGAGGGLRRRLDHFLDGEGAAADRHGGMLPARMRDPVAGGVFLVGDAAGQCLPLTGEGIRPALVFGYAAGRLAARALAGELLLADALERYRSLVLASRFDYRVLGRLQRGIGRLTPRRLLAFCLLFGAGPVAWLADRHYWAAAPIELLDETRGAGIAAHWA
jgi:flavin-dependent dehydrogenase